MTVLLAAFGVGSSVPFLFAEDLAVKLVCLHVGDFDVTDSGIMETGALLANRCENVQYRFLVKAGQSADGSYADTFTKQLNDLVQFGRLDSQAV